MTDLDAKLLAGRRAALIAMHDVIRTQRSGMWMGLDGDGQSPEAIALDADTKVLINSTDITPLIDAAVREIIAYYEPIDLGPRCMVEGDT